VQLDAATPHFPVFGLRMRDSIDPAIFVGRGQTWIFDCTHCQRALQTNGRHYPLCRLVGPCRSGSGRWSKHNEHVH
jgi:hypothetical protein